MLDYKDINVFNYVKDEVDNLRKDIREYVKESIDTAKDVIKESNRKPNDREIRRCPQLGMVDINIDKINDVNVCKMYKKIQDKKTTDEIEPDRKEVTLLDRMNILNNIMNLIDKINNGHNVVQVIETLNDIERRVNMSL